MNKQWETKISLAQRLAATYHSEVESVTMFATNWPDGLVVPDQYAIVWEGRAVLSFVSPTDGTPSPMSALQQFFHIPLPGFQRVMGHQDEVNAVAEVPDWHGWHLKLVVQNVGVAPGCKLIQKVSRPKKVEYIISCPQEATV